MKDWMLLAAPLVTVVYFLVFPEQWRSMVIWLMG